MEMLAKLVTSLMKFFMVFTGFDGNPDKYVSIGWTKPSEGEKKVVPFGRTDVPHLGPDHDMKVKQAELMFDNDDMRYKWLMAIHRLRISDTGWIMDKSNNEKKFTKWGFTNLTC